MLRKIDRLQKKLNTLDEAIKKATATLANLDAATEFTMTVVAAQNDDRIAYDTLKRWSEDKNIPFLIKSGTSLGYDI